MTVQPKCETPRRGASRAVSVAELLAPRGSAPRHAPRVAPSAPGYGATDRENGLCGSRHADNGAEPSSRSALPGLPIENSGPPFAEPWQAQAFGLALVLANRGHFTWTEWTAALSDELQAAATRGEPDDESAYYSIWVTTLERLVISKGLAAPTALLARKEAWADAYRTTPHGVPVELSRGRRTVDARWLLVPLVSTAAAYGLWQWSEPLFAGPGGGLAASAGLGALLGIRHAFEPDHLAALSALLTGSRNVRKAAWVGAYWGIGHTLTLLAAGTLFLLARAEMPTLLADVLAGVVVVLLIGLGCRAIVGPTVMAATPRAHSHRGRATPGSRRGWWDAVRRPLLVGAAHGLAGSGALTALVMTTMPSTAARLTYLLLFGVGSTCGMAALSGLMGWPMARIGRHPTLARGVAVAVGSISILVGMYWGYPLVSRLIPLGP